MGRGKERRAGQGVIAAWENGNNALAGRVGERKTTIDKQDASSIHVRSRHTGIG